MAMHFSSPQPASDIVPCEDETERPSARLTGHVDGERGVALPSFCTIDEKVKAFATSLPLGSMRTARHVVLLLTRTFHEIKSQPHPPGECYLVLYLVGRIV